MCTLIALWKCHPSAPLILALNRDELLARPSGPLALWVDEPILAGRDLKSGGTWFGVGCHVVAALTNHRSSVPSLPGERSRGELVVRALRQSDLHGAERELASLPMEGFGRFHMLVCDGRELGWITNRNGGLELNRVEPGAHVLGNYGLDNEDDPVVATLHQALRGVGGLDEPALLGFLQSTLARGGHGWPCVDMGAYGTRNSAIVFWGGEGSQLWTVEGSPARDPWVDQTSLLSGFRAGDQAGR